MFSKPAERAIKRKRYIDFWLCGLSVSLCMPAVHAQDFVVKPARCVALHEGQSCYAKVHFYWQLDSARAVCIARKDETDYLRCWEKNSQGEWQTEFQSEKSGQFILVDRDTRKMLDDVQITVVWVYDANSRRKSHWRIF